ncbi:Uncharacterized protein APZ42_025216 [Daphnia magna]|uniref:Uncharacterized protein n=1 Tax=Daphnia magna TaxID=35525 RepID=A0A164TC68_9CRUS|nr:Uncharacterized protein APZ42_025216 [Daphnia magna]
MLKNMEMTVLLGQHVQKNNNININQKTKPGNYTALHLATMYSQVNVIRILIEHGANTEITDVNGDTPRDYASDRQKRNVFEDWDYIKNPQEKSF